VNSNRFRSVSASNPFPASAYGKPPLQSWDTIDFKFEISDCETPHKLRHFAQCENIN
jgi:hypothetical protein